MPLKIGLVGLWTILAGVRWVSAAQAGDVGQQNRPHVPTKEWACSEQGVICSAYTPLAFESKNGSYYAGYVEESRRLPSGVWRRADAFEKHRIPMPHPVEDIHDVNHYSAYRLCYDQDTVDGTNECHQAIQPQPEIGEVHPEFNNPKRRPYNLLMVMLDRIHKEIGPDKAQYLVINLWMQENREPSSEEKRLFEKKWKREREVPQTVSPMCPWDECDPRYRPGVPMDQFSLRYRFMENSDKVFFQATSETQEVIKNIRKNGENPLEVK